LLQDGNQIEAVVMFPAGVFKNTVGAMESVLAAIESSVKTVYLRHPTKWLERQVELSENIEEGGRSDK
jgi:hypothetical protein